MAAAVRRILAGTNDGATATSRAIAEPPGALGWFPPDSPIWQVHGDVSTFLGGIRAQLLQTLHPLALAGIEGHSSYRDDPFGRLHRTGAFIAATTFGSVEMAERTVAGIARRHEAVSGTIADGRSYSAADPALLAWVHMALVDSMVEAYLRFGTRGPLDADRYVADMAVVGQAMGVPDPPASRQELAAAFDAVRPALAGGELVTEVRQFVRHPPLALPASSGYAVLARAAEDSLPRWGLELLGASPAGRGRVWVNRALAQGLLRTLRTALVESPSRAAARHRLGLSTADMQQIEQQRSASGPTAADSRRRPR